jgi:glycosyltransferase involved in cell wall biosynthesis
MIETDEQMPDREDIIFICDPLLSEYGPLRPAILTAQRLMKRNKRATMVSTTISSELQRRLSAMGIRTVDLRKEPFLKKNESIAWLEEWIREAVFSMNSRGIGRFDGIVLNFSNTICLPAHVWYAQGPPTVTLDNMERQLPLHYRMAYQIMSPMFRVFDRTLSRKIAGESVCVVANSKYLESVYRQFGVKVDRVIYPPLDCEKFKSKTPNPSEEFVLTYFGKEAIFGVIRQVLDLGLKVKAFGGKLSMVPKKIREHPNLDFLGRVSDDRLIGLYSNALFTFYPFTDEPFGYIPIESLACGTPVLTFNKQGPVETVRDGETGWLANDDLGILRTAVRVWNHGYPRVFRQKCRESALRFDSSVIGSEWEKLLTTIQA